MIVAALVGSVGLAGCATAPRHALGHCFERNSVLPERKALAEAMRRSLGAASPDVVRRLVDREGLVTGERNGRRMATTREVLAEENRMIAFARDGRGKCRPLGTGPTVIQREWLNEEQKQVVRHVLESPDRVMLVRGAAGTGKTTTMKEAVERIEAGGTHVHTFAPSAEASRGVLRTEGFRDADTVARLLIDRELQSEVAGGVIWIDEAGLLGSRTMGQVFDLADKEDCRVVLSGDRRQHGSVERGAALRLLEEEAGIRPAEIREIHRQSGDYKAAVRALSEGRTEDGFRQLDKLGWIRELNDGERYAAMARDYVATLEEGKTALVVSPTHFEAARITAGIRKRLKDKGIVKGEGRRIETLENANLTEADRAEATSYNSGDVLVFHQNARGYRRGQRVVAGARPLPLEHAAKFQVFHPGTLEVAAGDTLRITHGGTTADGEHRLNNGTTYTVKGFTKDGDIRLTNGWTIAQDYGHLAYGYVSTSHASQGKNVKRVFIGQSADSLPASSMQQFYVSVSRGREGATIYTDDKAGLLEAVRHSDERLAATDLFKQPSVRERAVELQREAQEREVGVAPELQPELEEMISER